MGRVGGGEVGWGGCWWVGRSVGGGGVGWVGVGGGGWCDYIIFLIQFKFSKMVVGGGGVVGWVVVGCEVVEGWWVV